MTLAVALVVTVAVGPTSLEHQATSAQPLPLFQAAVFNGTIAATDTITFAYCCR